jgi:hypothetical protein
MISLRRIQEQNALHNCINKLEIDLAVLMLPWLNQKVAKVKGDKVAKLEKQFEAFASSHGCNQPGADIWLNFYVRYHSLVLSVRNIKASLSAEVYVGRCNDEGILTELKPHTPLRTDYTLGEVESAFSNARDLEGKARNLLSSVSVFRIY